MPDIIQKLKATYISNPTEALDLIPEVIQQYDDGRIVELPCKVGDTVQVIFNGAIHREYIASFQICGPMRPNFCIMNDGMDDEPEFKAYCHCEDFGKTVFLTESEAKEHLKNVQKGF